jgi:NADPH:quinone reductase-like Zn-dependent oxidoreductase
MRAITIVDFNADKKLMISEVPTPEPLENEVKIKICYTSVNPVDWKVRKGFLHLMLPHEFPLILGWDAAGIIAHVGENVKNFKRGDRVFAYCRKPTVHDGTYAEYICVNAHHVARIPDNISDAQAAAIPLVALTAWQALFDKGNLKQGDTLFIQGGAGGVGSLAIELAKQKGAKVITTASTSHHAYVKALGADCVIDYNKEDIYEAVFNFTKEGCDMVFDCVGGDSLEECLSLLKEKGHLVSIVNTLHGDTLHGRNIKFDFIFVKPNGKELQHIADLLEQGLIQPPHIQEMDWTEVNEAHNLNKKGHTQGKIVLKIT